MNALELRVTVYRHFVESGKAPTRDALAGIVGDLSSVDLLLGELQDRHMLVLDDRPGATGEIRMALPFATEPTNFRVTADAGAGTWWANCAWDSFAMIAALQCDGRIESTWADTGEPVQFAISAGRLDSVEGHVHFAVPAWQWWDDIVFT